MKKFVSIILVATVALSVVSCSTGVTQEEYNAVVAENNALKTASTENTEAVGITADTAIDMNNIDAWLGTNARFVDTRDAQDMFVEGYIMGFETVPFFDYLEGLALVRNNEWEYSSEDLVSEDALVKIFGTDKDAPIVLMCTVGIRSGYVADALIDIGYTNVHNAGGFEDYNGIYKIEGDPEYTIPSDEVPSLDGVTVDMSNIDNYLDRPNARYIDVRNFEDMFNAGYIYGFEVVPFFQYLENRALVRNDEWNYSSEDLIDPEYLTNIFGPLDTEIFIMCAAGTRAEYVKLALEEVGYTNVHNIGGFKNYNGNNKVIGDGEFVIAN
ncbi:MAG: rhodanese-like domain-containing protein [Lachnospirales bacterium]